LEAKNSQVNTEQMKIDEGSSPHHQVSLQSMVNLPGGLTFDVWFRGVDGLAFDEVDRYLTTDIRLGWQVKSNMELSITGRNILGPSHIEFVPQFLDTIPTEVEKSVSGKVTWAF
jgi:iron complex outermembrane receptor protein